MEKMGLNFTYSLWNASWTTRIVRGVQDGLRIIFGRRVRELRHMRGLSQEALAHRCGLHPTYIAGIEAGKRNPSLVSIGRLAEGLAIHISELFPRPTVT